jgi:hypothetical protein
MDQALQVPHGVANALARFFGRRLGGLLCKRWGCQHHGCNHKRGDLLDGLHSSAIWFIGLI